MKGLGIGLLVAIIIVGAAVLYFYNRPAKTEPEQPAVTLQTTGEKQEVENVVSIDSNLAIGSDSPVQSGSYKEYSKAVLEETVNNRRVLFFYAEWCPECKPADAEFKSGTSKLPSDLTVIKVNYNDTQTDNEEKNLAAKYGITYQHTYVQIDSDGKEITKWNGGGLEKLLSSIK